MRAPEGPAEGEDSAELSAGAILLQKLAARNEAAELLMASCFQDLEKEEDADVVLRQEERAVTDRRPLP